MKSQFDRVFKIAKGRTWWTLRSIENECYRRFGVRDTQPAISARLRETGKLAVKGYVKDRKVEKIHGKRVYFYRLLKIK